MKVLVQEKLRFKTFYNLKDLLDEYIVTVGVVGVVGM